MQNLLFFFKRSESTRVSNSKSAQNDLFLKLQFLCVVTHPQQKRKFDSSGGNGESKKKGKCYLKDIPLLRRPTTDLTTSDYPPWIHSSNQDQSNNGDSTLCHRMKRNCQENTILQIFSKLFIFHEAILDSPVKIPDTVLRANLDLNILINFYVITTFRLPISEP